MITKDVLVGHWETTKQSGAMLVARKKTILKRVVELQKAVKFAREEANNTPAPKAKAGETVFNYLFG